MYKRIYNYKMIFDTRYGFEISLVLKVGRCVIKMLDDSSLLFKENKICKKITKHISDKYICFQVSCLYLMLSLVMIQY